MLLPASALGWWQQKLLTGANGQNGHRWSFRGQVQGLGGITKHIQGMNTLADLDLPVSGAIANKYDQD